MRIAGIIPARYGSTRFPGKPLVTIQGISMIERVYRQASASSSLETVIVATDDERILNHVQGFGGRAVMTGSHHRSGTERCAEVVSMLDADGVHWDAVINIQGDEPFIDPRQIDMLASVLSEQGTEIATLIRQISNQEELINPNVVKVVCDHRSRALLFSRARIPFARDPASDQEGIPGVYMKHLGIYGYQSNVLLQLVKLPACDLENIESLEQLRWLYYGYTIATRTTSIESISVDTPDDLLKITNTNIHTPRC